MFYGLSKALQSTFVNFALIYKLRRLHSITSFHIVDTISWLRHHVICYIIHNLVWPIFISIAYLVTFTYYLFTHYTFTHLLISFYISLKMKQILDTDHRESMATTRASRKSIKIFQTVHMKITV